MTERPKTGEFCWNELVTPNLQKAKDFMEKCLVGNSLIMRWEIQPIR